MAACSCDRLVSNAASEDSAYEALLAKVDQSDFGGAFRSVFLDDGTVLEFSAKALHGSGLRLLRAGQRVRIGRDAGGAITAITLATFPGLDD